MARFRRRKPRVVWLPPSALNRVDGSPAVTDFNSGLGNFSLDITGGSYGASISAVVPVWSDLHAPDFDFSGLNAVSLSDMYNSGYRLRRIVGKLFIGMQQSTDQNPTGGSAVAAATAGFIVLRTNAAGDPIDTTSEAYSATRIGNWSDPWIWRRTWILSDILAAPGSPSSLGLIWPESNAEYGSVMDGPHVDAKTARVISAEERLFLVVTLTQLAAPSDAQTGITGIRVYTDLRGVATLQNNLGNRRNASR